MRVFLFASVMTLGLASAAWAGEVRNFKMDHVPGEFIVKFHQSAAKDTITSVLASAGAKIERRFRASGAYRVTLEKTSVAATLAAAQTLAARSDVQYVEANTLIQLANTPNDPRFSSLWGMEKIKAEAAWELNTGSRDVIVGVIDTGVDHQHPDIAANYWHNVAEMGLDEAGNEKSTNGVDDDGNGYIDDFRGWDFANNDNNPMDDHNHGTHCAGTIGGEGNNDIGVAGVSWNVSIVGLKFITAQGQGTTADAIEAIEYATQMGFDLTSNSWGGSGFSSPLYDAIAEAKGRGILFVAAAGNSYGNSDLDPLYPAAYDLDNVISVAATDSSDRKASFSNYGQISVDLAAPGVGIMSTIRNNSYSSMSGTSMAAPHVAGAVALIKAHFPELTATEVRQRLLDTVEPISSMTDQVATGGRLNLEAALTP